MTDVTAESADGAGASPAADLTVADQILARAERIPFTRRHLKLAAMLGSATLFDSYDSNLIATALIGVSLSFGLSLAQLGVVVSAAQFGQIIGALGAGILSERLGRRTILVWSFSIFAAMSLLAGLSQNLNQLLITRFIQGFGLGAEVPIAASLFNEFVRGKTRGLVVGLYESIFGWGGYITSAVGFIAYGLFAPQDGWRLFFFVGGLPLILTAVRARWLPESFRWLVGKGRVAEADSIVANFERAAIQEGKILPAPVVVHHNDIQAHTNYLEIFSHRYRKRTIQVWFQWFTAYYNGLASFVPVLYVAGGLAPTQAVTLGLVTQLIGTAWSYTYIPFFDRVGRKPMFAGGFIFAGLVELVGLVVIVVFHYQAWPVLFGVVTLSALGTAVNSFMLYIYTPEIYPTRMRAWGTASSTSFNRLAGAVSPIITGLLLSSWIGLAGPFIILIVLHFVCSAMILVHGTETKGRQLEDISP